MSALASANPRNFGVKRIMKEYAEFQKSAAANENDYFEASPCEDNLFEWHFTIRGPPDSDYQGGRYHGRILLPSQYPFKPPDIVMLTPSGRFETNKKICLSISSFHPKNWQPSWSIRTVLTALIAFFPTPGNGAIGSLEYSSHERKEYAARSSNWSCELCGKTNLQLLPDLAPGVLERAGAPKLSKEVLDTIDQNKAIAAVTVASQPGTPAVGPTATPSTPLNLSAGHRIAAEGGPSNPTSPGFIRSYSEPVAGTNTVGSGEMILPPPAESTLPTATAASSSATSTSSPTAAAAFTSSSSLILDEGLRQRQGVVTSPHPPTTTAVTSSTTVGAPAVAAVQQPNPPPQPAAVAPPANQLSSVTVFLAFLIFLILLRKLYASTQAKQAFSFDFSQE